MSVCPTNSTLYQTVFVYVCSVQCTCVHVSVCHCLRVTDLLFDPKTHVVGLVTNLKGLRHKESLTETSPLVILFVETDAIV